MQSASKNVLIGYNCIVCHTVTPHNNFPSNKVLLALDWSHQELVTTMHDLEHTLVLVGVTFQGLKSYSDTISLSRPR